MRFFFTVVVRITDVAYKVFFGAIETQGRALLRVPLVSTHFCLPLDDTQSQDDTGPRRS
jgi:hypothetical protein